MRSPNWIQQQVLENAAGWRDDTAASAATASGDDDILLLEPEALAVALQRRLEAALACCRTARVSPACSRCRCADAIAEQTGGAGVNTRWRNWARLPEFCWHNGDRSAVEVKARHSGRYA
ncbi:MAG: hypothetical protein ACLR17_05040 [Enterobacteriaceae bacterium]